MAAENEGVGLFDMERAAFELLGGVIKFNCAVTGLIQDGDRVTGVMVGEEPYLADAVIFASGGFEASDALRARYIVPDWVKA